ncbi:MAG: hypothetical protein OHK0013_48210 [Sandaracinaceae bacterium]
MHDAGLVRGREAPRDRRADVGCARRAERSFARDQAPERAPDHELHREVARAVVLAEVVGGAT